MISAQFFVSFIVCNVILQSMLGGCAYLIFLERKVCAWCQDRIGPNRTGLSFGQDNLWNGLGLGFMNRWKFAGLGQALADGVKLFFKEEFVPPRADKALFILAPIFVVVPAMIGWAVIPWGGLIEIPDIHLFGYHLVAAGTASVAAAPLNVGVVYILAIGSLAVYGVVLGAYASNNKYSFLGGVRATAQMVSYEIPMGICVLIAILTYQTLDAGQMVNLQASSGAWGLFMHPLLAAIFFTCILAECNRAPFDLAEAESELIGGYHTEYSSMKWALFFLGEYMHMITGSAFFVVLFMGGWSVLPWPFQGLLPVYDGNVWVGLVLVLIKFHVFIGKVVTLLFIMMWIRWTLPRFRFDQLMRLAWQSLIPMTVLVMVACGVLVYMGWTQWWCYCLANIGVAVVCSVAAPHMPKGPAINRRVRLPGSRFYAPLETPSS